METNVVKNGKSRKVVVVTNIPAPYREPVYSLLSKKTNVDLKLLYCQSIEKNRLWKIPRPDYPAAFLKTFTFNFGENAFHFGYNVILELRKERPDVLVINGLNPTMIAALVYSLFKKIPFVYFSDGTIETERSLPKISRLLRRFVLRKASALVGPSIKTKQLYESYGADSRKFHQSHLAIDNLRFKRENRRWSNREFDVLFSGQLIHRKSPFFFLDVVKQVGRIRPKFKAAIIGSGPLEKDIKEQIQRYDLPVTFFGFIQQDHLPRIYGNSKVLLMPTLEDCWGVVANEAIATGSLVITTPNAGVAGELIVHDESGFVLNLDAEKWCDLVIEILNNHNSYERVREAGLSKINSYTYLEACNGLYAAIISCR